MIFSVCLRVFYVVLLYNKNCTYIMIYRETIIEDAPGDLEFLYFCRKRGNHNAEKKTAAGMA
jgi:hypothetical protein